MKSLTFFGILALLIFTMIPSCQATIVREEEVYYPNLFSFKVRVIVETEYDGTWRQNKTYTVTVMITLTYINETSIRYVNFNQTFFNPFDFELLNTDTSIGFLRAPYYTHASKTFYLRTKYGYPPRRDLGLTLVYYFYLESIKMEKSARLEYEPIYIEVRNYDFQTDIINHLNHLESQIVAQLNTIKNMICTLIFIMIVLIATNIFFGFRKTKKQNRDS